MELTQSLRSVILRIRIELRSSQRRCKRNSAGIKALKVPKIPSPQRPASQRLNTTRCGLWGYPTDHWATLAVPIPAGPEKHHTKAKVLTCQLRARNHRGIPRKTEGTGTFFFNSFCIYLFCGRDILHDQRRCLSLPCKELSEVRHEHSAEVKTETKAEPESVISKANNLPLSVLFHQPTMIYYFFK